MCGLAGIHLDAPGVAGDPTSLARRVAAMSRAIAHRGPNSTGAISASFCEARFRRLSIMDLETGDQPLWNERRTIAILFNGEIYNHAEIRRDLEARGHRLDSSSDGAVLPHLFEELGERFAEPLNGMYAILVVDLETRRTLLARDPVGIKPLYTAAIPGATVFASELKSVLASELLPREIDAPALESIGAFLAAPGPGTAVRGVIEVAPGATVELGGGPPRTVARRTLGFDGVAPRRSEAEALGVIRGELDAAVRRQLVADVPVGVALSGGVDSLVLAAAIPPSMRHDIVAVTVDFGTEADAEDIRNAGLAARHLGLEHVVERVDPSDAVSALPSLIWWLDLPIADPAALSMQIVARVARRRVKVLLSGTGGDELFGGYGHYRLTRSRSLLRRVPRPLRNLLLAGRSHDRTTSVLIRQAMNAWNHDRSLATVCARFTRPPEMKLEAAVARYRGAVGAAWAEGAPLDIVNRHLLTDFRAYLGGQTLPLLDRLTMAEGIEGRVPLLDLDLVRQGYGVHGSLKVRPNLQSKHLLRRLAAERLPPEIASMPKRGFTNPVQPAMSGSLGEIVRMAARDPDGVFRRLGHGFVMDRVAEGAVDLGRYWLFGYALLVCTIWERMHVREHLGAPPECGLREYVERPLRRRAG